MIHDAREYRSRDLLDVYRGKTCGKHQFTLARKMQVLERLKDADGKKFRAIAREFKEKFSWTCLDKIVKLWLEDGKENGEEVQFTLWDFQTFLKRNGFG